ncbi:MAG: protein phosphatase 2C domain-containing protein [Nocardioides sp.]|nr:protein phosphatase 2C domain-containing protein [Nocardioides sp.]
MSRRWTALSGTQIGSVHMRDGLPLQDCHGVRVDGVTAYAAVADGHGHHLHFRSDVGAKLAVDLSLELLAAAQPRMNGVSGLETTLRAVGADLVDRWTGAVYAHLEQHPFDAEERALVGGADREHLTRPYGSTVLAMVATGDLVGVLQIGDGDAVVVTDSGRALRPVPEDPALDGTRTTSLCQADPIEALRVGALDAAADEIVLGYLCTDGFSNSRVDHDGWWQQTGAELLSFAREHGFTWVGERLPGWLEEPARIGGDDTTLALLARADLAPSS